MLIFFFFASTLYALHLYNKPKFMVIGNPVILEQSHAHNAPDLWDRGSIYQTPLVHDSPATRNQSSIEDLVSQTCFNENLNASRPSEHPPVREENISKRLGGIIGYKTKPLRGI